MGNAKVTPTQLRNLAAWERFLEVHLGCYPASIAALKLRMTATGVYNAADRGHIAFFLVGRDRWYSRRDVIRYRWENSRKFRDNRRLSDKGPKNFLLDFEG